MNYRLLLFHLPCSLPLTPCRRRNGGSDGLSCVCQPGAGYQSAQSASPVRAPVLSQRVRAHPLPGNVHHLIPSSLVKWISEMVRNLALHSVDADWRVDVMQKETCPMCRKNMFDADSREDNPTLFVYNATPRLIGYYRGLGLNAQMASEARDEVRLNPVRHSEGGMYS